MTKEQAIHKFWASFGVPAFEENTVPDDVDFEPLKIEPYPRITYEVTTDDFNNTVISSASIWDRSNDWKESHRILNLISEELGIGGTTVKYDSGLMWIKKGTPFSRHIPDDNKEIRHISMNLETDFVSSR